eukprot:s3853_g5.t1
MEPHPEDAPMSTVPSPDVMVDPPQEGAGEDMAEEGIGTNGNAHPPPVNYEVLVHTFQVQLNNILIEQARMRYQLRDLMRTMQDWSNERQQIVRLFAEVAARAKRKKRGSTRIAPMARQLRRAITADALTGRGAALFILCSPPADAEDCEVLLRRSEFTLQIAGVLGGCPEDRLWPDPSASAQSFPAFVPKKPAKVQMRDQDPEVCFERLVKVAAAGSELHLWFGETYWTAFAEARHRQLQCLQEIMEEEGGSPTAALLGASREVVSGSILDLRLLERIMRECYVDEQRCDEELQLLTRLLARDLYGPEEIKMAMRPKAVRSTAVAVPPPTEEAAEAPPPLAAPCQQLRIDVAKVAMSSSMRGIRFDAVSSDAHGHGWVFPIWKRGNKCFACRLAFTGLGRSSEPRLARTGWPRVAMGQCLAGHSKEELPPLNILAFCDWPQRATAPEICRGFHGALGFRRPGPDGSDSDGEGYWRFLCERLAEESEVYVPPPAGVCASYQHLIKELYSLSMKDIRRAAALACALRDGSAGDIKSGFHDVEAEEFKIGVAARLRPADAKDASEEA